MLPNCQNLKPDINRKSWSPGTIVVTDLGLCLHSRLTWFSACADNYVAFSVWPYTIVEMTQFILSHTAIQVAQWNWVGKSRSAISNMWEQFAPTRIGHVIRTACAVSANAFLWYPMGNVRTYNSRTDSHRIFKLGGGVEYVICHVWPLTKIKRSKVKATSSRIVSAARNL